MPRFPQFKPLEIYDQEVLRNILWPYQPELSEFTFTNLFAWRSHYDFHWSIHKECLILLSHADPNDVYAFQPIGTASRLAVTIELLEWLKETFQHARIERADKRLLTDLETKKDHFIIEPARDHFDYVYKSEALIKLAGNKYHSKRNHLNKFMESHSYGYEKMGERYIKPCMELVERWCGLHRCGEDLNLMDEWEAIGEALAHFDELKIQGGLILIDGKVEAFALGELLDKNTAVVHFEKANPAINGLYTVINQSFVEKSWKDVEYINRAQDLGQSGLRKAKLSYHPDHFAEKFTITLRNGTTRQNAI